MSLNDQYEHGRIPLRPLAYDNKDLAQTNELVIDYGRNGNYHIYITDSEDPSILIDFTDKIVREVLPTATINANQFKINIEGIQEPSSLRDIINHIYKRYIYADNENGFFHNKRDIAKVYDPNTKSILLRNDDGTILLPVTLIDNVFDSSGKTIEERLNNSTRFSYSEEVINVNNTTDYEFNFIYPYKNYAEAIQVYIDTAFVNPSEYSIVNDLDDNEEYINGSLVFYNSIERYLDIYTSNDVTRDIKITIVFLYNTLAKSSGEYEYVHGTSIANKSIPSIKLAKTSDSYATNDTNSIATSAAVYNLYNSIISNTYNNTNNTVWMVDEGNSNTITINMPDEIFNSEDPIVIHTSTKCVKNINCSLVISNRRRSASKSYALKFPDGSNLTRGIPANKPLTIVLYPKILYSDSFSIAGYFIDGISKQTTVNRLIHVCTDQETDISYGNLNYNSGDIINVYRNGIRLFEDIDYSINIAEEIITLLTRAEDGEKLVFEAISY